MLKRNGTTYNLALFFKKGKNTYVKWAKFTIKMMTRMSFKLVRCCDHSLSPIYNHYLPNPPTFLLKTTRSDGKTVSINDVMEELVKSQSMVLTSKSLVKQKMVTQPAGIHINSRNQLCIMKFVSVFRLVTLSGLQGHIEQVVLQISLFSMLVV